MRVALGLCYRGQRLLRLAKPARRPKRCRTTSKRRWRAFAVGSPRVCAQGAPMPACMRSIRSSTSTPMPCAAAIVGARHQPLSCPPTSPCNGADRSLTTLPCASQRARAGATSTCCSNRRCGRRLEPGQVGWTFRPLDGARDAERCRRRLIGEHDFSAFRSSECQARDAGARRFARSGSRGAAPTGASTSTRTPSCTTWCATSWAASSLVGSGDARRHGSSDVLAGSRPQPRRADVRAAAACTSRARTTMPYMPFPTEAPPLDWLPWTTPMSAAHADQDLRRDSQEVDVATAVAAGADAVGLVLYAPEPALQYELARAAALARLPAALRHAGRPVRQCEHRPKSLPTVEPRFPQVLLQFHGDETPGVLCELPIGRSCGRPGIAPGFDLLDFVRHVFRDAQAILLDAHVEAYGGGGKVFDWSLIRIRRALSGRFVWWVACRKCHSWHPRRCGPGPLT